MNARGAIANSDDATVDDRIEIPVRDPSAPMVGVDGPAAAVAVADHSVARTLDRALTALWSMQNSDGHWRGELEGDSILASEYILMKWILRQEDDSRLPRILRRLRRQQRPDGGWGQFPGSGIDVSATVKAYVCLMLDGDDKCAPHMQRAQEIIRAHGGAERTNSFSNFYLACLGLISWDACPAIAPEMVWQPRWSPFHLDNVSAWSRTMILPLAICSALRPVRHLSEALTIDHLFLDRSYTTKLNRSFDPFPLTWNNVFLLTDRALKSLEAADANPLRQAAIRAATDWVLQRADPKHTAGLGAIFPPMVYIQIALDALGFAPSHPLRQQTQRDLDDFIIDDPASDCIRIEPCFSPVWDTGIALYALTDCGFSLNNDPDGRIARACDWLRGKQVSLKGDWSQTLDVPSAGWAFEYRNDWYPDSDDTAMVAMALRRCGGKENLSAAGRGVNWMLAMQNDDGGWAAFDRTRDRPILEAVPFADHNAIQDPSCPDITGRVLECLSWHGLDIRRPEVRHAVRFIHARQDPAGCWFGRWGVNYIYGTWQVVCGLQRIGCDISQPWIRKAGAWLKSVQKEDGSFGESANSYQDPALKGRGPSTASQTAWGAMALQAIFGRDDPAVGRAIQWLCAAQLVDATDDQGNPPGSWTEHEFTGTGFPRVFYLRYHLYRLYFPIMALGRYLYGAHKFQVS